MAFTWEDEEIADQNYRERVWEREQEERDAREALDAIDPDAAAPAIAEPVAIAVNSWLDTVAPGIARIAPRYAMIANGIAVRVGDGRKRRAHKWQPPHKCRAAATRSNSK